MRRESNYPMLLKALMLMALCVMTTPTAQAEVVNFPDKNLEAAIRRAIHKPTGDILDTETETRRNLCHLNRLHIGCIF